MNFRSERTQMLFEQDGNRFRVLDDDMVVKAMQIERAVGKIVRTHGPIFKKESGPTGVPAFTRLGNEFNDAIKEGVEEIRLEYPTHTFHPLLNLFEKHTRNLPSGRLPICAADVLLLNQRVANMREEAKSDAFRSKRDRYIKASRKNQAGLEKFIDAQFMQRGRLLVVRLDVGYRQARCFPFQKGEEHITLEQADAHRKAFLRSIRGDKKHPLLGYAGTMELGGRKWLHYHWAFFFDGDHLQNDIGIAQILGERWRKKITRDEGTYWNCNSGFYVNRGIGSIRYCDHDGINALKEHVATYLTKPDYYVRMIAPKKRRFFRGVMPTPRHQKRGRRRKGLLLVDQDRSARSLAAPV